MPALAASKNTTSPAAAALPYTHGLKGVNIPLDIKLSHIWWSTVGTICLIVLIGRLVQKAIAYIRHVLNLTSSERQQAFWATDRSRTWPWIKKNLLYAPLWRKRHNREFQLSRAVNVGTLPSRFHTFILSVLLISNIIYCLLLDWKNKDQAAVIAELRGRTGNLATVLIAPLVLLAGRNNLFIPLLGVSFDTFNLFHRWIGRLVVLNAMLHTLAWAANTSVAKGESGLWKSLIHSNFLGSGMAATLAMLIILFQSPSAIRHAFYETFKQLHIVLAWTAFIGVWLHCRDGTLPQKSFMDFTFVLWICEHMARWTRVFWYNFDRKGSSKWTQAFVEALPEEACRVAFQVKRPWNFRPGCHVYVRFPAISGHMSHPFSIAWTVEDSAPYRSLENDKLPVTEKDLGVAIPGRTTLTVYCIMAKRSGMTEKLYNKVTAAPTGCLALTGLVEGPYGGLESLHSYGTTLLFAGGVGITHQLGMVRDLLRGYAEGTVATRRVVLVWSVRRQEQFEWVQTWLDEILKMPKRKEILSIELYVSKPRAHEVIKSRSERVQMFPGRCKPEEILAKEMSRRVGTMAVTVCGPGAFADEVRAGTRAKIYEGAIDFIEESFTW